MNATTVKKELKKVMDNYRKNNYFSRDDIEKLLEISK